MEERRRSQRVAVRMAVDLILSDENGKEFVGPVRVELENLSLEGGSVALSDMKAEGFHLFYGCHDRDDRFLVLRFVDQKSRRYAISCKPAWFNKELDEEPAYYQLGLEFLEPSDRENIRLLNRLARGKTEKGLSEILGDFFKKQLIRES